LIILSLWKNLFEFFIKAKSDKNNDRLKDKINNEYEKNPYFVSNDYSKTEDRDSDENKWNIMVRGETEEEKFLRQQQDAVNKLRDIEDIEIREPYQCNNCPSTEFLLKGRDGKYYCKDHILPENREIISDLNQSVFKLTPKPDTRCKNPDCNRAIYHKDIIQCGPCGEFFCKYCWEDHRWTHGRVPAVGISYYADGTFSGYDGTEQLKRDR
jgi:hypothetical protein